MTTQGKNVNKKPKRRGRGRPKDSGLYSDKTISVRLPDALMKSVKTWAARHEISSSEALRRLVEIAINAER